MATFSIGWLSFAASTVLVLAYLLGHLVRKIGAWAKRDDQPKDRVWFFASLVFTIGFVLGSLIQPHWDAGLECQKQGKNIALCVFLP